VAQGLHGPPDVNERCVAGAPVLAEGSEIGADGAQDGEGDSYLNLYGHQFSLSAD
jgi:hypothetical protein